MNPFTARKISYLIIALGITATVICCLCGYPTIALIVMAISAMITIGLLALYWRCPECRAWFPISMSLDSKFCPLCGKKITN